MHRDRVIQLCRNALYGSVLATLLACGGAGNSTFLAAAHVEPPEQLAGSIVHLASLQGHPYGSVQGTVSTPQGNATIFDWSDNLISCYVPASTPLGNERMTVMSSGGTSVALANVTVVSSIRDIAENAEPNDSGSALVGTARKCHGNLSSSSDVDQFEFRQIGGGLPYRISVSPAGIVSSVKISDTEGVLANVPLDQNGEGTFTPNLPEFVVSLTGGTGDYTVQLIYP